MTALEFTTNFVIKTLQENRSILESTLPSACSCNTWEDAIEKIRLNKYDTVDWVLSEVFTGHICKNFEIFNDYEIDNVSESDEYMEFIYPIEGRNIMIRYSTKTFMTWNTIKFFFVEKKEILIPKTIWQIVEK
jgi:hypothetical protein